jgi:ATP-dependent Lon protease
VVRLSGYIADEKRNIARKYLEKSAKERSGVGEAESSITDPAMTALIEHYCREAGVRNLQKHLEKIYRKVALKLAKSKARRECSFPSLTFDTSALLLTSDALLASLRIQAFAFYTWLIKPLPFSLHCRLVCVPAFPFQH